MAITIGGQDYELSAEDLLVAMQPLEGYQVEREGSHAVALELEIDDDLRARDGRARSSTPSRRRVATPGSRSLIGSR